MQKLLPLFAIIAIFPMFSTSQVKAEAPQAPVQNSRMDLDVSPILQLGPADPMPSLGIHPMRAVRQGPSREEKIAAAAHWLKVAAGAKPVLIEIPDTGYTVHLTGDPQTLQQLKDAVAHANNPNRPQVLFECRLFTMSTDAIQKLDESLRKKLLAAMVPGSIEAQSVTPEERNALAKACTTSITEPRLMLADGQSGYALVSTSRAFVSGVKKVAKASTTQPSYEPEIAMVDSGAAVGAKVNIKPKNKVVAVEVKTQVANLLEMKTSLADPADKMTQIQIPTVEIIKFEQLCSVGDGESVLCHGEREIINGPTTQPAGDDVFFVITCNIAVPKK